MRADAEADRRVDAEQPRRDAAGIAARQRREQRRRGDEADAGDQPGPRAGEPGAARRIAGLTRSLVADAGDLVALDAARRLHLGDVALDLADQRARDRRADRDQALLEVGLVVADDLVGDLGAAVFLLEVDGRAEDDPAVGVDVFGSMICAAASLLSTSRMRPSMKPCLSLAASYSAFSDRSPWARASEIAWMTAWRSTFFSRLSSSLSFSAPRRVSGMVAMASNLGKKQSRRGETPAAARVGGAQSSAVRRAVPAATSRRGRRGASCLRPPPRSRPCWCST